MSRFEPTKAREQDGAEVEIPTYSEHLLCDDQELYPAELGTWEKKVLEAEQKREGFKFWYRNPDRPSQDSLGVAYTANDDTRIVRPDFVFLAEHDGEIVADIVDPHGFHLADALPKLKGLSRYAENHSEDFRRIEAVADVSGTLRALDLTREDVREEIMKAESAEALYEGALATDY